MGKGLPYNKNYYFEKTQTAAGTKRVWGLFQRTKGERFMDAPAAGGSKPGLITGSGGEV